MKGICFKEPLFLLTAKGIKTQTRRMITPQPQGCLVPTEEGYSDGHYKIHKPRYKKGETVYLKEPYAVLIGAEHLGALYKYSGDTLPSIADKWENKLFMPASAARYFIKITAVRAERLQDISEDDCLKEGIPYSQVEEYGGLREAYAALIDIIHGKGTWKSNPYMWVYDYELTEKPKTL